MEANMENITLPKIKYEDLRRKASLYEEIFRFIPERVFGIELYSDKRIKEFMKEDRMDKKERSRLEKLLKVS